MSLSLRFFICDTGTGVPLQRTLGVLTRGPVGHCTLPRQLGADWLTGALGRDTPGSAPPLGPRGLLLPQPQHREVQKGPGVGPGPLWYSAPCRAPPRVRLPPRRLCAAPLPPRLVEKRPGPGSTATPPVRAASGRRCGPREVPGGVDEECRRPPPRAPLSWGGVLRTVEKTHLLAAGVTFPISLFLRLLEILVTKMSG